MWLVPVVAVLILIYVCRWRASGLPFADYLLSDLARCYASIWQRCRPCTPPFPPRGPALVVCNHTCSADPVFLLRDACRFYSFVITREHYHLHPLVQRLLAYLRCVPVKRGGHDPVSVRQALRCLQHGRILCFFPEGNLSGVALRRMRRWKHGAAYLALKSGVPVYPVWIEGGPQTDRLLRAWLSRSGKAVRVVYGAPVDLSPFYRGRLTRKKIDEVTTLLMNQVCALKKGRNPNKGGKSRRGSFHGFNPQ